MGATSVPATTATEFEVERDTDGIVDVPTAQPVSNSIRPNKKPHSAGKMRFGIILG